MIMNESYFELCTKKLAGRSEYLYPLERAEIPWSQYKGARSSLGGIRWANQEIRISIGVPIYETAETYKAVGVHVDFDP